MREAEAKATVEALLFVSGDPLPARKIAEILAIETEAVERLLSALAKDLENAGRGLALAKVAGGYQLSTKAQFAPFIEKLAKVTRAKLSMPAMETLSIVAFRQPITKQEIEQIRGVKIDRILNRLEEQGLVKEIGRKPVLGRPVLYATTDEFLRCFGLDDLSELPKLPEAEKFFEEVAKQVDASFAASHEDTK